MSVYLKLVKVQSELKAPKSQYNSFGKYSYRIYLNKERNALLPQKSQNVTKNKVKEHFH